MTAAVILIGAPGAGKTSVLEALSTLLEIDELQFGAIESEQLAQGSPLLGASQWIPQLEVALTLQRKFGRQLFLVTATTENTAELRAVVNATGADRVLVVALRATADLLERRLAGREADRWPGKQTLIEHARTLADTIPELDGIDLVIDTDTRDAEDVARQIRDATKAAGLLTRVPA